MRRLLTIACAVVVGVGTLGLTVGAMTVEEALAALKQYDFGGSEEVVGTLRVATVGSHGNAATRSILRAGYVAVLESTAAYGAKDFACRQLALIGTQAEVPALAAMLTDDSLSHIARYALAQIGGAGADQALLAVLGQTSGKTRLGIIHTLGNRGTTAALEPLKKLLGSEDAETACEAARSLGRIGGSDAASALEAAMNEAQGRVAEVMADSLLVCADGLAAGDGREEAARLYERVFLEGPKPWIRAAALRGLALTGDARAAERVGDALLSRDRYVRETAARLVQEVPGRAATYAFAGRLAALPAEGQMVLLRALTARADKAALPTVVEAAGSRDASVRVAALEAIGRLGDGTSVGILAERAASSRGPEQAAARAALSALSGRDVAEAVVREMKDATPAVRVELIDALRARRASRAIGAIRVMAEDRDARVRAAAYRAIGELGGDADIEPLAGLLVRNPSDREDAARAMVSVARRVGAEREASLAITRELDSAAGEALRVSLLGVLGKMGDSSGLGVLRAALSDEGERVRYVAVTSLAVWPTGEPADDLLKVAATDRNRTHRTLALRGYIDVVGRSTAPDEEKLAMYESAMSLAGSAEKRQALAGISQLRVLAALEAAARYLEDRDVKNEAAMAAVKIADRLRIRHAEPVREVVIAVLDGDFSEAVRDEAGRVLSQIEAVRDCIVDWEVSGPYTAEGKGCSELFDVPFAPEMPGADAVWSAMPYYSDSPQAGYLDLLRALNGGDNRVAYLRTVVKSDADKTATLEVFSDDGVKVWLNGDVVHANNVLRPIPEQPDRVEVRLRAGENTLMLKVTQNNMPWGAIVRIRGLR